MFHILLENPEYENYDLDQQITQTILEFPEIEQCSPQVIQDEWLAEYAALEFLFPYQERKKILQMASDEMTHIDYSEVAERYKIPKKLVEIYLTEGYMNSIGSMLNL